MVSAERALGYAIVAGMAFAVIYKILMTPHQTTVIGTPTAQPTTSVSYVPYPTPYPVPYTEPTEPLGSEGPSQDESMGLALSYVMSQPPYTQLSCTTPTCTDVDTLRTPYAWRFKFEFTCDPLAVVRIAYVTVVNGSVTDFSVTP